LVRKFERKRLFGRCRWEGNTKMNLMEVGYEDVDWL
jgi:hypothetical protein